jgi:hypothetical protein
MTPCLLPGHAPSLHRPLIPLHRQGFAGVRCGAEVGLWPIAEMAVAQVWRPVIGVVLPPLWHKGHKARRPMANVRPASAEPFLQSLFAQLDAARSSIDPSHGATHGTG